MGVNWRGAITRTIVSFLAIWALKDSLRVVPPVTYGGMAIVAVLIGVIGYLGDEVFGGYLSAYGRGLIGFVAAGGVCSVYFSFFYAPNMPVYHYGYLWSGAIAVAVGLVVGIADGVLAFYIDPRQRVRDKD